MSTKTASAVETSYEVADEFRCAPRTIQKAAAKYGIGVNLGGSAGWRFTAEDKQALWDALRTPPKKPASADQPRPRRPRKKASR